MSGDGLRGEELGALAVRTGLELWGAGDPRRVYSAARESVEQLERQGVVAGEEARLARLAVLARFWQGFGVPGAGPDRFERRAWWAAEFRRVGWGHLWDRGPRPGAFGGPTVLYRGATVQRRLGLAWTPDREVAAWFAARAGGVVWQLGRPPADRCLAAFPIEVLGAGLPVVTEYVVDAGGLALEVLS